MFDSNIAEARLAPARKAVSDGIGSIEKRDYAAAKLHAYNVFLHSMQAMLLGYGENCANEDTPLRFRQRFMDTGIFPDDSFGAIETVFMIRGREAYEDESLLGNGETELLMREAESFYRLALHLTRRFGEAASDPRAAEELERVKKIIALAEEFDSAYSREGGDAFMVYNNDAELYGLAKTNLHRMLSRGQDGVMEAFARCSLWLIGYNKAPGVSAEAEKREALGVLRELARTDPAAWARDTADLSEDLADGLCGDEATELYSDALRLYRYLYETGGDARDLECIENLCFKLGIEGDE